MRVINLLQQYTAILDLLGGAKTQEFNLNDGSFKEVKKEVDKLLMNGIRFAIGNNDSFNEFTVSVDGYVIKFKKYEHKAIQET